MKRSSVRLFAELSFWTSGRFKLRGTTTASAAKYRARHLALTSRASPDRSTPDLWDCRSRRPRLGLRPPHRTPALRGLASRDTLPHPLIAQLLAAPGRPAPARQSCFRHIGLASVTPQSALRDHGSRLVARQVRQQHFAECRRVRGQLMADRPRCDLPRIRLASSARFTKPAPSTRSTSRTHPRSRTPMPAESPVSVVNLYNAGSATEWIPVSRSAPYASATVARVE